MCGFFRGFGATALRDAPHAGLYVAFYEAAKRPLAALLSKDGPSVWVNLSAGVLAGLSATLITQPVDLVKTRIQLSPAKYRNFVRAVAVVWREEGARGFMSGVAMRVVRKSLSSAITWSVYEEIRRMHSQ